MPLAIIELFDSLRGAPPLLRISPARTRFPFSNLTGKTRKIPRRNVGGGSALPALPRKVKTSFRSTYPAGKKSEHFLPAAHELTRDQPIQCGRERYIGEGGFGARERDTQRLSYVAFFWYFSWRSKKSTYAPCSEKYNSPAPITSEIAKRSRNLCRSAFTHFSSHSLTWLAFSYSFK